MITIHEFPGRQIFLNGTNYLYFGGTAYLGLQTDPDFQSLFIENIRKYGTGYGSSRRSNIRLGIFEETENYLSQLVGSESCITLSSGYLAGQLVCNYFSLNTYTLFYAPHTHSALFKDGQNIYEDWELLKNDLNIHLNQKIDKTPVLFLDSIDFSGDNFPMYHNLKELPLHRIIVVVDDSHGIGITGEQGGGSFAYLNSLKPKELVVSCSLGKGFGIQAGAIFGSQKSLDKIRDTLLYGGASPSSPSGLATLIQAEDIRKKKREKLQKNVSLFLKLIGHKTKFIYVEGHPTFGFVDEALTRYLEQHKILITHFRYPNKTSPLTSRIVINSNHTKGDIKILVQHINSQL